MNNAASKKMVSRLTGAIAAFMLLLPIPALAYTISSWTFNNNGVSLSEGNAEHTHLLFGGAAGGANYNAVATSTVTGSAGEMLNSQLDMSGLTMIRGTLTVTIKVGTTTVSQTFSTSNPMFTFPPILLAGGAQNIQVTFQFSSNALFTYSISTPYNLRFY